MTTISRLFPRRKRKVFYCHSSPECNGSSNDACSKQACSDILARRARQQGKSVLWLPGTDHAKIATQTKVEKAIEKMGRTREFLVVKNFTFKLVIGGTSTAESFSTSWKTGVLLWLGEKCTHSWRRLLEVSPSLCQIIQKGLCLSTRMVNWCPPSNCLVGWRGNYETSIQYPVQDQVQHLNLERTLRFVPPDLRLFWAMWLWLSTQKIQDGEI